MLFEPSSHTTRGGLAVCGVLQVSRDVTDQRYHGAGYGKRNDNHDRRRRWVRRYVGHGGRVARLVCIWTDRNCVQKSRFKMCCGCFGESPRSISK